jgi:O-antigen/teichoic acid export membrane protein
LFFIEGLPVLASPGSFWETLYHSHNQLYYIFLGNLLASGITFALLLPILRMDLWRWDLTVLKKMLRYSWPLVIVAIAGVINQSSAITFQKLILPDDLTTNLSTGGVYAAAAALAILLNLFTIAFNYAAEPFFFAHMDKENAKQMYADVALLFTLAGSVIMLFILGYMDLIQLLLGKNFRAGLAVVPVLLVSYLLLGIYYNVSTWYKLTDKTRLGAWIAVAGTLVTIGGNILLIPVLGVMGSAMSALACYLLMCILSYLQGQKYFPIPYNISRMALWIGMALFIYYLMNLIQTFLNERLPVILVANTLLIAIYLLLVFRFEKS